MRHRSAAAAAVAIAAVTALAAILWAATRPSPTPSAAARSGAQVIGRVEVAAGVPPALPDDATVVVYAYALDGPRLPLAVFRRPASALPLDFKLDDSLAQNPAYRLSQAAQLVVGARLGSGDAPTAQAGDWLAPPQTVPLGTHGVRLVLQPPR